MSAEEFVKKYGVYPLLKFMFFGGYVYVDKIEIEGKKIGLYYENYRIGEFDPVKISEVFFDDMVVIVR